MERDPGFVESQQHLAWAQVERSQRELEDVLRRRDLDAIRRLYTAATRATTPQGGLLSGPEEVAAFWERSLDESSVVKLETEELYLGVERDVATQVGSYRIVPDGGIGDAGTAITVWAMTVEGWKIHRSTWASDTIPTN